MRPAAVTTGASPNNFATAAPSSVADITSRRSSGERFSCESSANARPVSACRLRSWNSSNSTAATPSSAGSLCSMRVNTPSVTTSMRVRLLDARFQAHAVAHGFAGRFAQRRRHARRHRARREPARLEHHDLAAAQPRFIEQRNRNNGALAGAGRRFHHGIALCAAARRAAQAGFRRWEDRISRGAYFSALVVLTSRACAGAIPEKVRTSRTTAASAPAVAVAAA